MTLPTGSINFNNINVELGRPGTQALSLNDGSVRQLSGQGSGAVDMNSLRGKSNWTVTESTSGNGTPSRSHSFSSNQTCSWSYSVSHSGSGTVGASPANGGSATSASYSLTARTSGSNYTNDSATFNVTATYNGQTKSYSFTLLVGNQ